MGAGQPGRGRARAAAARSAAAGGAGHRSGAAPGGWRTRSPARLVAAWRARRARLLRRRSECRSACERVEVLGDAATWRRTRCCAPAGDRVGVERVGRPGAVRGRAERHPLVADARGRARLPADAARPRSPRRARRAGARRRTLRPVDGERARSCRSTRRECRAGPAARWTARRAARPRTRVGGCGDARRAGRGGAAGASWRRR